MQDSGKNDQIISFDVNGLYVTIFTFPDGRIEVDLHGVKKNLTVMDIDSDVGIINLNFRKTSY